MRNQEKPLDKLTDEELELFEEGRDQIDEDTIVDDPLAELAKERKAMLKQYDRAKVKVLKQLDRERDRHLVANHPEMLEKYSPKYNLIVKL
mgnify:CR=1 FL=1